MKNMGNKENKINNIYHRNKINNIFKLESLSHEICKEHKTEYAKCILCQALQNDISTDHKMVKVFYARFAKPLRPSYHTENTDENYKKSRLEILKNCPGMLFKKRATYYDTLLYSSDLLQNCLPYENKFRIFLWLAAKFYDVKKLTGFNVPRLTKQEVNDLDYTRKFIFERQISILHDKIRYERSYD